MSGDDLAALLDAMDGVAYVTDRAGIVRDVGVRNWTRTALGHGDRSPTADDLIGRDLFDFITPGPVRLLYRNLHDAVVAGARPRVTFTCRCDAPEFRRQMRMSIGAVHRRGEICSVLYHSQIVLEAERPPLDLLTLSEAASTLADDMRPIVNICSFCQSVCLSGCWVQPEEYYRRGGNGNVRLSHAVCPSCEFDLVNLSKPCPDDLSSVSLNLD